MFQDTDGPAEYAYEAAMEERYMQSLVKSFKKTLIDGLYHFLIIDCYNITLEHLNELHASSKQSKYYVSHLISIGSLDQIRLLVVKLNLTSLSSLIQPYICEMPLDVSLCLKQNIHNRNEADIRRSIDQWIPTPSMYTVLKYDSLFVDQMEDISDDEEADVNSLDAVSDDEPPAEDVRNEEISSEDEEEFNEVSLFSRILRVHCIY